MDDLRLSQLSCAGAGIARAAYLKYDWVWKEADKETLLCWATLPFCLLSVREFMCMLYTCMYMYIVCAHLTTT